MKTFKFLFSLQVVIMFLGSIFIPQFLGALRLVIANPPPLHDLRGVCKSVLQIIFSPCYIYVERFRLMYLELKLKIHPNEEELVIQKEQMKRALNMHIKLELGLETIYQLSGQLILLLMAWTETPTQSGLKTMFKSGISFQLIISNLLSFWSCISSHLKALTACREHFPFKTTLTASFYCFFGISTRVVAIVMFFAGPLGLFSLHRHLQGEQYPWHKSVLDKVNKNGTINVGSNQPFDWKLISETSRDYTHYCGFRLRYYLIFFFVHLIVNVMAIFVCKLFLSKNNWNKLNLLEKIIHCLENTNIPYNVKEWDDDKGNADEHRKRMRSNWFEVLSVIILKSFFNLFLILPFAYLGKSYYSGNYPGMKQFICYNCYIFLVSQMKERHDILARTIGYLNEEMEALEKGYWLLYGSIILLSVGTFMEILFFWLYNDLCHPFANILKEEADESKCKPLMELLMPCYV